MIKRIAFAVTIAFMTVLMLSGCSSGVGAAVVNKTAEPENTMLDPERTWAVLLDMNDFEGDNNDLKTDFANSRRMYKMLEKLGCDPSHIIVEQDNVSRSTLINSLNWLKSYSKSGDTLLLYVSSHGGDGSAFERSWNWNTLVPNSWKDLKDRNKILLVEACFSERYIQRIGDDVSSYISIAACEDDELSWCGLEEEGLPIIGSIFTYYFTDAVTNPKADVNHDSYVSLEEAVNYANPEVQKYMAENVFTVPEFLEGYHKDEIYPENKDTFPNAVMNDNIRGEFLLYKIDK